MQENKTNSTMKKPIFALALLAIVTMAFTFTSYRIADGPEMPEDVKEIVDNKCYGCHSADGKSDKAKEALMWDDISTLSKVKMIGKLDDISEAVQKGEMPPEKFLEKFPDKKLTEEESKLLIDWADATANKILE